MTVQNSTVENPRQLSMFGLNSWESMTVQNLTSGNPRQFEIEIAGNLRQFKIKLLVIHDSSELKCWKSMTVQNPEQLGIHGNSYLNLKIHDG